ncbi:LOW QUALITY PROTEIN: hypothetical protein HID58_086429, partial [Brassica napus]
SELKLLISLKICGFRSDLDFSLYLLVLVRGVGYAGSDVGWYFFHRIWIGRRLSYLCSLFCGLHPTPADMSLVLHQAGSGVILCSFILRLLCGGNSRECSGL